MGQHLSIGLLTKLNVRKKGLSPEKMNDLKKELKIHGFDLDLYKGTIEENSWSGTLKPRIVEEELLTFLRETYSLLQTHTILYDEEEVLARLEETAAKEWMGIIAEADFYNFQEDQYGQSYRFEIEGEQVGVHFTAISLKMAGKISLESDGGLFDLFTDLLQGRLKSFKLAKALRVYVTG